MCDRAADEPVKHIRYMFNHERSAAVMYWHHSVQASAVCEIADNILKIGLDQTGNTSFNLKCCQV